MNILEAAEKILRDAGGPLDCSELTRRIIARGYWTPVTKTPAASVGSAIYVHIKKGGKTFVRVGKGTFALSEMAANRAEEPTLFDMAAADCVANVGKPKKEPPSGYVYILTNPSLKGMVKIGKTRRPVNTRSKELYNTAIPTEFVEYASLKTSKYAQVEELVHRILTKLTRKRVNERREFYKIKPQEALEILTDVSGVLDPDDRWFHVPGQKVIVKPIVAKTKKEAGDGKRASRSKRGADGGGTWSGKTQLAKLIATRGGNVGAYGGILHYFAQKRSCPKESKWRQLLEDAGIKFDANDFVVDWSAAKNPLPQA